MRENHENLAGLRPQINPGGFAMFDVICGYRVLW
jgi:hypothetical protein